MKAFEFIRTALFVPGNRSDRVDKADATAAIQLEGKFIDYPVVERSRRILRISKLIS